MLSTALIFSNILVSNKNHDLQKRPPYKNKFYRTFRFPVTICIYINTEYRSEHSFKVIIKRSRLRNKFLRNKTEMTKKEYKKQKKEHFANLDINSVSGNKNFEQIMKPLF